MIPVVFDHPDFIIIDKPANLPFHGQQTAKGYQLGIVDLIAQQTQQKLWPVHRLDTMTSGLLILAKHAKSAAKFGGLFHQKRIQKFYLALSQQKPKKKQGWVKGDMKPARRGNFKLCSSMENPAITQFISVSIAPSLRLFLLKPHTGKTHQLRVMMKSLGSAINGDIRYQSAELAQHHDRGYLHAFALQFEWHDQVIEVSSLPTEGTLFNQATAKILQWQKPWLYI